jgi:hypothetical protein
MDRHERELLPRRDPPAPRWIAGAPQHCEAYPNSRGTTSRPVRGRALRPRGRRRRDPVDQHNDRAATGGPEEDAVPVQHDLAQRFAFRCDGARIRLQRQLGGPTPRVAACVTAPRRNAHRATVAARAPAPVQALASEESAPCPTGTAWRATEPPGRGNSEPQPGAARSRGWSSRLELQHRALTAPENLAGAVTDPRDEGRGHLGYIPRSRMSVLSAAPIAAG